MMKHELRISVFLQGYFIFYMLSMGFINLIFVFLSSLGIIHITFIKFFILNSFLFLIFALTKPHINEIIELGDSKIFVYQRFVFFQITKFQFHYETVKFSHNEIFLHGKSKTIIFSLEDEMEYLGFILSESNHLEIYKSQNLDSQSFEQIRRYFIERAESNSFGNDENLLDV